MTFPFLSQMNCLPLADTSGMYSCALSGEMSERAKKCFEIGTFEPSSARKRFDGIGSGLPPTSSQIRTLIESPAFMHLSFGDE